MEIVYTKDELEEYLQDHVDIATDHPILVDDYLDGRECDVDAICDGKDVPFTRYYGTHRTRWCSLR